jgi:hypothetical protein
MYVPPAIPTPVSAMFAERFVVFATVKRFVPVVNEDTVMLLWTYPVPLFTIAIFASSPSTEISGEVSKSSFDVETGAGIQLV